MLEEKKLRIENCDKSCFSVSEESILKGFACEKCGIEPTEFACLSARNIYFLTERLFDGCLDDLLSLIRIAWNNYSIGQIITIVEQTTRSRELKEEPINDN